MSSIEIAVRYSKEIESLLEDNFGAMGRGLHQKISSVEHLFPAATVKQIRYVATLRNKAVHEAGFEFDDPDRFIATCEAVIDALAATPVSTSVFAPEPSTQDAAVLVDSLEERFRKRMTSLMIPVGIVLAAILGGLAMMHVGLGAAILAGIVGFVLVVVLFSEPAVEFYIGSFYVAISVAVIAGFISVIVSLWSVGGAR